MRALIQRVKYAGVHVGGVEISHIEKGLLILLGIEHSDDLNDVEWLTKKIVQLRIFDDAEGVMNLSVKDVGGNILVVSQFTLHARTKKGNRPSYADAAVPDVAIPLYEAFISAMTCAMGRFC
jgi:D-aminoacyl-tRNA deacylase